MGVFLCIVLMALLVACLYDAQYDGENKFFVWPVSGQEVEPETRVINRDFGWKGQTIDVIREEWE